MVLGGRLRWPTSRGRASAISPGVPAGPRPGAVPPRVQADGSAHYSARGGEPPRWRRPTQLWGAAVVDRTWKDRTISPPNTQALVWLFPNQLVLGLECPLSLPAPLAPSELGATVAGASKRRHPHPSVDHR